MSRTRQKNATAITPALICGIGGHGVTIKYPLGGSHLSRNYGETPWMFSGDSSFDGIRYLCAPWGKHHTERSELRV